jgi:threonine synthase
VTTAVLKKLADRGDIEPSERVVIFITGEGLKTLDAVRELVTTYDVDPASADFAEVVPVGTPAT